MPSERTLHTERTVPGRRLFRPPTPGNAVHMAEDLGTLKTLLLDERHPHATTAASVINNTIDLLISMSDELWGKPRRVTRFGEEVNDG